MKPEHRSALIALAASRGDRGFSGILEEAIEQYLEGEHDRRRRREELLALAGSLSAEDASELRSTASALRNGWR